ncbi:serine/threonine protein kinase [Peribacillus simplex]|uniref:non-specific serine/threonine protein kinase n=1 Tax=Peribacillus simplex TaxID=1478 RepID=A0A9X8WMQ4_9BACI|nr:serine/threonine protein kinase [Peribacillus simplex]
MDIHISSLMNNGLFRLEYMKVVREVSILRSLRKIYQFFVDIPLKKGVVLNDRYEVKTLIGTGSYGLVYLCNNLKKNENIVIKQLRNSKRRSKKELKQFENEMTILRMLNHKNIPKFHENFSHDGNVYFVMDFIEGDNLEDHIFLNQLTFNEKESLLFLDELVGLVSYLHGHDICHQDLRIPNILLKNHQPILIDFGLSKMFNSADLAQESILQQKRQDFYDLGQILLYVLYTTYASKSKKALPWTEELSLEKETVHILKRLLSIQEPYSDIKEISMDLRAALQSKKLN